MKLRCLGVQILQNKASSLLFHFQTNTRQPSSRQSCRQSNIFHSSGHMLRTHTDNDHKHCCFTLNQMSTAVAEDQKANSQTLDNPRELQNWIKTFITKLLFLFKIMRHYEIALIFHMKAIVISLQFQQIYFQEQRFHDKHQNESSIPLPNKQFATSHYTFKQEFQI